MLTCYPKAVTFGELIVILLCCFLLFENWSEKEGALGRQTVTADSELPAGLLLSAEGWDCIIELTSAAC